MKLFFSKIMIRFRKYFIYFFIFINYSNSLAALKDNYHRIYGSIPDLLKIFKKYHELNLVNQGKINLDNVVEINGKRNINFGRHYINGEAILENSIPMKIQFRKMIDYELINKDKSNFKNELHIPFPIVTNDKEDPLNNEILPYIHETKVCNSDKTLIVFEPIGVVLEIHNDRVEEAVGARNFLEHLQRFDYKILAMSRYPVISNSYYHQDSTKTLLNYKITVVNPDSQMIYFQNFQKKVDTQFEIPNDWHYINQALEINGLNISSGAKIFQEVEGTGFLNLDGTQSNTNSGYYLLDSKTNFSHLNFEHLKKIQYYSNGLLLTSYQNQGEALLQFLENKGILFDCIFAIGNTSNYVEEIRNEFIKSNISEVQLYTFIVPNVWNKFWKTSKSPYFFSSLDVNDVD